jgi:photosystem II stability/assembly factor-like uncharacterized protein
MKRALNFILFFFLSSASYCQVWKPVFLPEGIWTHIAGESQGNLFLGKIGAYVSSDWTNFTYIRPLENPIFVSCNSVVNRGTETFGAFNDGIYKSVDGGFTWALSFNTLYANYIINDNDTLYCGGIKLFRSIDGGNTWTTIMGPNWDNYAYEDRIEKIFIQNGLVYFQYKNSLFSVTKSGGDSTRYINNVRNIITDGHRISAIISNHFHYSDDNGLSWNQNDSGFAFNVVPNCIDLGDTMIYASTGHGLYSSSKNYIHWYLIPGYTGSCGPVQYINSTLFLNSTGPFLKSKDKGLTWTSIYQGIYPYDGWGTTVLSGNPQFNIVNGGVHYYRNVTVNSFEEFDNSSYFYGTGLCIYDKMFMSNKYTSDGINWIPFDGIYSNGENMVGHKGKLYKNIYHSDSILRSDTSDLITWSSVNTPANVQIRGLYADEDAIYMQAWDWAAHDTLLFISQDEGTTWTNNPLPGFGQMITYHGDIINYDRANSYISHDGGLTWSTNFSGLPGNHINTIVNHLDTLFCIGLSIDVAWPHREHWDVYKYNKDSTKWFLADYNIHSFIPDEFYYNQIIAMLYSDNKNLYASVSNFGLWQLTYNPLLAGSEKSETENIFTLFPNPSTGKMHVTIKDGYILKHFTIKIYNGLGEKVKDLLLDNTNEIDLSIEPKGIYFVLLISGKDEKDKKNIQTQKIIIQ